MDFDVSIIGVLLSCTSMLFMGYVWRKSLGNKDFFMDIFDDLLHEASTNEEMAKKLYLVGAIVGNGLKQGIGLQNLLPKTGKFRFEDIIGLGIQRILGSPQGEAGSTPQIPQSRKQTPQM